MATNPELHRGLEWLSRTLAVLLVMAGPGLLGSFLDARLGVHFLTPTGLILGTILGTFLLILLARKLTPVAGGKPIPFDEDEAEGTLEESDDKINQEQP